MLSGSCIHKKCLTQSTYVCAGPTDQDTCWINIMYTGSMCSVLVLYIYIIYTGCTYTGWNVVCTDYVDWFYIYSGTSLYGHVGPLKSIEVS